MSIQLVQLGTDRFVFFLWWVCLSVGPFLCSIQMNRHFCTFRSYCMKGKGTPQMGSTQLPSDLRPPCLKVKMRSPNEIAPRAILPPQSATTAVYFIVVGYCVAYCSPINCLLYSQLPHRSLLHWASLVQNPGFFFLL